MDRLHGRATKIKVGATSTALGSLKEWNRDANAGEVDVTACEDTDKTYLTDLPDHAGVISVWWVGDDAGQVALEAAFASGASIDVHVYPDGVTTPTTGHEYFGSVKITRVSVGGGVNSAYAAEFGYRGALTYRAIPTA